MYEALKASRKEYKLLVEDSYAQIYKIAWLKLKGIDFDKDNLDVILIAIQTLKSFAEMIVMVLREY